ncbi:MAG: hypothetical protein ABJA84_03930 [Polaromonas sp.]
MDKAMAFVSGQSGGAQARLTSNFPASGDADAFALLAEQLDGAEFKPDLGQVVNEGQGGCLSALYDAKLLTRTLLYWLELTLNYKQTLMAVNFAISRSRVSVQSPFVSVWFR